MGACNVCILIARHLRKTQCRGVFFFWGGGCQDGYGLGESNSSNGGPLINGGDSHLGIPDGDSYQVLYSPAPRAVRSRVKMCVPFSCQNPVSFAQVGFLFTVGAIDRRRVSPRRYIACPAIVERRDPGLQSALTSPVACKGADHPLFFHFLIPPRCLEVTHASSRVAIYIWDEGLLQSTTRCADLSPTTVLFLFFYSFSLFIFY